MLNKATIMGRLTKDPELRQTQTGRSVCSFTIASDRDFSEGGEKKADFIDCVAWGGTGEFVSRYFGKGKLVVVEGRLQLRDWTDKDGNKRRNAEINVLNAYFCGGKNAEPEYEKPTAVELEVDEGELPF